MNIIELVIDENDELSPIEAVSVVESPAIEESFIALKKQANIEYKLAEVDKKKKILMGAALIPEKPIYRQNGEEEFYIYFSKDTVRKASQMFLQRGKQNKATLEHEKFIDGMSVVESWIVEDKEKDKSSLYGLDVPVGTWVISMKVENEDIWQKVQDGEVTGFSIEGYFSDRLQRPKDKQKDQLADLQNEDDKLLKQLQDVLA
tara:strand:+ start:24549 stop:25157 length:609 start_codon:yes stop_codon:yes gene_type:complete